MLRNIYAISAIIGWRYPAFVNRFLSFCGGFSCPLTSSNGIRQFSHPDWIEVRGSIYLAVTPYPYGGDLYENPEVFASKNLKDWKSIAAVPPPGKGKHLSDPDLLYLRDKLYLIYRRCDRDDGGMDEILLRELENGKERILLTGPKKSLICPSSLIEKNAVVFVVDADHKQGTLLKYEFDSEWNLVSSQKCASDIPELWHIDIIKNEGKFTGLFLSNQPGENHANSLFLAESGDGGISFDRIAEMKIPENDISLAYRASLIVREEEYLVALSYRTSDGIWKLGFYRIERNGAGFGLKKIM